MNSAINVHCRLCAELKPHQDLVNLQTDEEMYQKVVNKLSRFNIVLDFQQDMLPKTVCSLCVQSLDQAFSFVIAVEQAQAFLSDFVLIQTRTEKSDSYGELAFLVPSDAGKEMIDIKVENRQDPMDVFDGDPNLDEDCDGIDGDSEEVHTETEDPTKSFVFVDEKYNIKDETDKCSVNNLKDKSLNFNNDYADNQYTSAIENNFKIQDSDIKKSKLKEKYNKDTEYNPKPNMQLENTIYSEDEINKINYSTVASIPPQLLDTIEYSEDYITKQINRLSTVPVHCLKNTWMEYEWKCSHCGTFFSNIEELQKHSMLYHNICNAYQCTDCKIKKQRLNAFIKHVRSHRKYLHYSCYRCFEKFPKIMETRHHKTKVHENSKYVCLGCNTPFSSKTEMEEHVEKFYNILWRQKTFISSDNLTCSTCNKVCASVTALRNHLNRHKEKKRDRICDRCGKCFDSEPSLRTHMDTHTERVLYHCEICKTTFKTVYSLRYHASIHSGIKPFTCDVCNKCFRTRSQITNHMKFHTDYFPLSCSVCNKKFRIENNLQNHMLQHTGEKPFSCDICPRDFTNMSNRNKHMRRRHGIEMAKRRQPIIKQQAAEDATVSNLTPGVATSDVDKMDDWKNKRVQQKSQRVNNKIKKSEGLT